MDIVLGVSMTPTTVRMVLVEGENADGITVDHDVFDLASDQAAATAPEQVVAAILGTRESAAEGGHRLVSTGVTWRDREDAARLKEAVAAHHIDDVMLVSELHAAGALAQAVGRAVGYERTALMFLDNDAATLSVVETSDGSIVRVERQDLHSEDAVAQLTSMVAGLEQLDAPPQGVFVVGSGVSVAALKLQLESASSLPVSAPDEPGLALARGAALAAARAPLFEASTVARAYAQDGDDGTTAGSRYPAAYAAAPAAAAVLAYSEVPEDSGLLPAVPVTAGRRPERKPFLLVGSAMTALFVLGVAALVISLAVSIRPTVDERPSPAESVIVPTRNTPPAAAVPAPPAPAPVAPPPETIQAPVPVVQEAPQPQAPAPRTVFVEAPAPAPAAPPPGPAPAAPAPAPAPVAPPPVVAPPVVAPVVPAPVPQLPIVRWPWQRQNPWPQQQNPWNPPKGDDSWQPWDPPKQQNPWNPPKSDDSWDPPKQQNPWNPPKSDDSWDPPKKQPSWNPSDDGDSRGGSDPGRGSNGGNNPVWPWPSWGN